MKAVYPLIAAMALAACAQEAPADLEETAEAPAEPAVALAADGLPMVGTFKVTRNDGSSVTVTTREDGSVTYVQDTGEEASGTYTFDEAEGEYCFDGEGEEGDYCSYHAFEDGVFTAGPKDDPEARVVVTRVE